MPDWLEDILVGAFIIVFYIGGFILLPIEFIRESRKAKKQGCPRPNPIGDLVEEDDLPDA